MAQTKFPSIEISRDDEVFIDTSSEILPVSLGADRTHQFVTNGDMRKEDSSVYVMTKPAQKRIRLIS